MKRTLLALMATIALVVGATSAPAMAAGPTAYPAPVAASAGVANVPPSGSGPLVCPVDQPNFESRGWWTPSADSIDLYRGVDMEVCAPRLLVGDYPVTLHVQLRHNFATITTLRVQIAGDYGQVVAYQADNLTLRGDPVTGDGEWYVPVVLHSQVAPQDGWQELRFTANIKSDQFGRRQYQSTGIQAYVKNGKTVKATYRTLPYWEARGWYEGVEYENVLIHQDPPSAPVSGTWAFKWEAKAGSGGKAITYHALYVDANTHAVPMVLPHVYSAGNGAFNGTTLIDTTQLTNGVHKLLLRADAKTSSPAGTTSGLMQILFVVQNGSTPPPSPTPPPSASPSASPSPVITPAPSPTPPPTASPTPLPSACGG